MPIFDQTPPLAAGLASAGNAMQAFQQARQGRERHAADMNESKIRVAAIIAQATQERRDRIRRRRSDAASVMALQQRALKEDASAVAAGRAVTRGADTAAAVAGAVLGPMTSAAVKEAIAKRGDALPAALQREMRQTQRLLSQMTPEDARTFMADRHADMQARTLAFEQARLMRDIESAANRGVFGDVQEGGADGQESPGSASVNNLMAIAQRDPVRARHLLQGLLQQHQRATHLAISRQRVVAWAQNALQMAEQGGASEDGLVEAEAMLAGIEDDQEFDGAQFRSKFTAALLKPNVPKVRVFGLEKDVEDRSGWSHGGFIEDMTPRQKSELTSIARYMARQDMIEEGLAGEADPLDPNSKPGLDPLELQSRTDDHLARLFAAHGWRNMGDDDFAYSRAGMPWESKGDFFQAWQDSGEQAGQVEGQKLEQASNLPAWESTPGDVKLRVAQKIAEFESQDPNGERGGELFDRLTAMGINPETVNMDEARSMAGKTELSDEEMQAELDQMKGYPLSDPKDVQRYEKELSRRQVQKGADKQNASRAAVESVAQSARAHGFPGNVMDDNTGHMLPASLEVLRRWYEKKGDQESAAAIVRIQRSAKLKADWSESELRAAYSKEQGGGGEAKKARDRYNSGDAPSGAFKDV